MTVAAHSGHVEHLGDDSTTAFSYGFQIDASSELEARLDGIIQTEDTHYTVSGVGDSDGGTVTFLIAPGDQVVVAFRRVELVEQLLHLTPGSALNAAALETRLDKMTKQIQMLQEELSRRPTFVVGAADTFRSITIPTGASQALAWNSDGTGLELVDLDSNTAATDLAQIDDISGSLAAMRLTSDPGEESTETQALTAKAEVLQLRHALLEAKQANDAAVTYWYSTPASSNTANIKTFGAVGDGVTDDTQAFLDAIDSDYGVIEIPPGNYRITQTLVFDKAHYFKGVGTTPWTNISGVDLRGNDITLDHDFNGTFLSFPGTDGNIPLSCGMRLENVALRQVYGNGSAAAGKAIDITGVDDNFRMSWLSMYQVLIIQMTGKDHWTYNMYIDGHTISGAGGLGIRDNMFERMYMTTGAHSLGSIYIRTGVAQWFSNIQIEGDATTNTMTITGDDINTMSQRIKCWSVQSTGDLVLDWSNNNQFWGCSNGQVTMTANSIGNNYWGNISGLPDLDLGGSSNYLYSVGRVYSSGGVATSPAFGVYRFDGNQTDLRLDVAAGVACYLDFREASTSKWTMGRASDDSFFLTHNSVGNVLAVTEAGKITSRFNVVWNGVGPTYGATVTCDLSKANIFQIDVSNNSNFTVTATNGAANMPVWIYVRNNSGGAMGTITWDASVFRMDGSYANPANTKQVAMIFRSDGTKLHQMSPATADVTIS